MGDTRRNTTLECAVGEWSSDEEEDENQASAQTQPKARDPSHQQAQTSTQDQPTAQQDPPHLQQDQASAQEDQPPKAHAQDQPKPKPKKQQNGTKLQKLVKLLKTEQPEQPREQPRQDLQLDLMHENITCGDCQRAVIGVRFKCQECSNYNLCDACETRGKHAEHDMIAITTPLWKRPARQKGNQVQHHDVKCDNCGQDPLVGVRYKCIECTNYDLCQGCEREGVHEDHDMIAISFPIWKRDGRKTKSRP